MRKFFLPVLLIISIAFSPIGQGMTFDVNDMVEMNAAMGDCLGCNHNLSIDEPDCFDGDCFVTNCANFSTTIGFSLFDRYLSFDRIDLSQMLFIRSGVEFQSQTAPPPYRPPII